MELAVQVLMFKWMIGVTLVFAGLEVQEWIADCTRGRSGNPF